MSFAGLSLETATRRGGFLEEGEADEMRVRTEVRFWVRVEARVGEMGISEVMVGLWRCFRKRIQGVFDLEGMMTTW